MITGILRPTSGRITFDGHAWKRSDLKHIGALIEMPPLYENLTAYEKLKVRTTILGLPLDEPANGLDSVGMKELRERIRSFLSKGITVILSSHILSEVQQIAKNSK